MLALLLSSLGGAPSYAQAATPAAAAADSKPVVKRRLPPFIKPLPPDAPLTSTDPRDLRGMWVRLDNKLDRILTIDGQRPPYLPAAEAAAALKQQANEQGRPLVNNAVMCRPPGFIWNFGVAYFPVRIMQTADEILFVFERFHSVWRIAMNPSRPRTAQSTYMGRSTGRWEGDTLVVETTGFPAELWLDESGTLISAAARVTSRVTKRQSSGELEIVTTIDDPRNYSRPWTLRQSLDWRPDFVVLTEHNCEESAGSTAEALEYGYHLP
jgi:hypothetical protein